MSEMKEGRLEALAIIRRAYDNDLLGAQSPEGESCAYHNQERYCAVGVLLPAWLLSEVADDAPVLDIIHEYPYLQDHYGFDPEFAECIQYWHDTAFFGEGRNVPGYGPEEFAGMLDMVLDGEVNEICRQPHGNSPTAHKRIEI